MSNPTFSPVTVVEPKNADALNIDNGHLDEIDCVSTEESRALELTKKANVLKMQMKTIRLITVRNIKLTKKSTRGDT